MISRRQPSLPESADAPAAGPRPPSQRPRTVSRRGPSETPLRWAVRIGIAIAALLLIWYFASLFVYLGAGILLAYLLKPIVDRVQGVGIGRIPAILLTVTVVIVAIAGLITYIAPSLVRQLSDLSQQVTPETLTAIATTVEGWIDRIIPIPDGTIINSIRRAGETLVQEERITAAVGSLVGLFTDLVYAVLVIPLVTFFFLKDGTRIRHSFFRLVPNRYFEITISIADKIESILGRYFRGLLLQSASIAVVASVLLYIIGLRYAVAVGLFTGIANTIPYFGPALGFLAGTIVGIAQTGDFALVPGVLVAMALTQISDNVFFQPLIFSRVAKMHPLVILFVVLIGAQLAGILGMLLAIPVATVVRVAVEQVAWSFRNYRILQSE